jgi:hypothetical protein
MSNTNNSDEDDVLRLVTAIDADNASDRLIRDVLCEQGFVCLDVEDDFARFQDQETKVVFLVELSKDFVTVTVPTLIPSDAELSQGHQVINQLNRSELLGKYYLENIDGTVYRWSSYRFPIYSTPLGYHSGWLAKSIRKFCISEKVVNENFLAFLKKG